jgi:uncharacterized repeat protein (TIGR03803 family)
MDGNGNLLGTAGGGGSAGDGLVFELSPNGSQWKYNVLDNFTGANGRGPLGMLTLDASGDLFGVTHEGGTPKKKGTVFEYNGSIQTVYSFCAEQGCPDGTHPFAGVIEDTAGNLYGTAAQGGHKNSGTIYELSP